MTTKGRKKPMIGGERGGGGGKGEGGRGEGEGEKGEKGDGISWFSKIILFQWTAN